MRYVTVQAAFRSARMTVRKKVTMFAVIAATYAVSFMLVDFVPARLCLPCEPIGEMYAQDTRHARRCPAPRT